MSIFQGILLKVQGFVILLCTEYNAHISIAIGFVGSRYRDLLKAKNQTSKQVQGFERLGTMI
jgi:hypothetical protein